MIWHQAWKSNALICNYYSSSKLALCHYYGTFCFAIPFKLTYYERGHLWHKQHLINAQIPSPKCLSFSKLVDAYGSQWSVNINCRLLPHFKGIWYGRSQLICKQTLSTLKIEEWVWEIFLHQMPMSWSNIMDLVPLNAFWFAENKFSTTVDEFWSRYSVLVKGISFLQLSLYWTDLTSYPTRIWLSYFDTTLVLIKAVQVR